MFCTTLQACFFSPLLIGTFLSNINCDDAMVEFQKCPKDEQIMLLSRVLLTSIEDQEAKICANHRKHLGTYFNKSYYRTCGWPYHFRITGSQTRFVRTSMNCLSRQQSFHLKENHNLTVPMHTKVTLQFPRHFT